MIPGMTYPQAAQPLYHLTSNSSSGSNLVLQVQNTDVNHSQRVIPSAQDCKCILYLVCLSIYDSPFSLGHYWELLIDFPTSLTPRDQPWVYTSL